MSKRLLAYLVLAGLIIPVILGVTNCAAHGSILFDYHGNTYRVRPRGTIGNAYRVSRRANDHSRCQAKPDGND